MWYKLHIHNYNCFISLHICPDVKELAKVRFRVFYINNNQLQKKNIVEIKDSKEKKEKIDSDSDVDSELSDGYDL